MRTVRSVFVVSIALLLFGLLMGCGGGGGSDSAKALARKRAVATTRIARSIFAVAGLGRRVTGAPAMGMGMGRRVSRMLTGLRRGRDVQQGKDDDTGLYYLLTTNPDGSGHEDLFTDAAHQNPAGQFTWDVPQWKGGQPGAYPALFHVVYQITAGDFAGEHGTMDVTIDAASGLSGLVHLILTDSQGDNCTADIHTGNGNISATDQVILFDGTQYDERDETQPDGTMICTMVFADGSQETMTMDAGGGGTETITGSDGTTEATGDFKADGTDTIIYDDGSQETFDVDTGEEENPVHVVRRASTPHKPASR